MEHVVQHHVRESGQPKVGLADTRYGAEAHGVHRGDLGGFHARRDVREEEACVHAHTHETSSRDAQVWRRPGADYAIPISQGVERGRDGQPLPYLAGVLTG
jgi:hypothetical protein